MHGTTEPRWLDEGEQRAWRAFIDAVRLCMTEIDRDLQHDSGLNHAYYQILVALSEAPGHTMRMSELATLTLTSRSRLSHAVARLEEAGWVVRDSCASDRRGAYAVLTPRGLATLETAARGHVESVRRNLFDLLSPNQIRQLGEVCAVLRDALNAGTLDCRRAEAEAEADAPEGSEVEPCAGAAAGGVAFGTLGAAANEVPIGALVTDDLSALPVPTGHEGAHAKQA